MLPKIEPLVGQLLERRASVIEARNMIKDVLNSNNSDFGGRIQSTMVVDFMAMERLIARVRSHGCLMKDVNTGLVDFLSIQEGREVYLCWKYGEPSVSHYHELHSGFSGRQPI